MKHSLPSPGRIAEETAQTVRVMGRLRRRNLKRPIVYPIPEELREDYVRARAALFRRQFGLVVNVIVGAVLLYHGLGLLLPVSLPLLAPPMIVGLILFEFVIWHFVSASSRLTTIRLLVLAAFFAPLLIFLHYQTEVSYYLVILFVMGLLAPWNGAEAALVSLVPWFGYLYSRWRFDRGVLSADEPFVLLLALGIVALAQFRQEWDRRARFVLEQEAAEARRRISDSLDAAARLHEEIISRSLDAAGLRIRVLYEPMQWLGGDFVKFAPVGHDCVALMLADVTGHGVPAALMVNRINARVETLMAEGTAPLVAARELSSFVATVFEGSGVLMSAFWAEFRSRGREIVWVGFGHPPALRVTRGGEVEELASVTHLLGVQDPLPSPSVRSQALAPGDLVVFYTDGLIETPTAVNPFRLQELKECLRVAVNASGGHLDAEGAIDAIKQRLRDSRTEEALDDLLVAVVETAAR